MDSLDGGNAWGDEDLPHKDIHPEHDSTDHPPPPVKPVGSRRKAIKSATLETLETDSGPLGPVDDPLGFPMSIPVASTINAASKPAGSPSGPTDGEGKTPFRSLEGSTGRLSLDSQNARQSPRPNDHTDPALQSSQNPPTPPKASKASFYIVVGDPHKVGDLKSHTQYKVRTTTTSTSFRQSEFEVSRRFSDFLWLYEQLQGNNPGIIVYPPPEKNALNRFKIEVIESRRQALERMLTKIASHPVLQNDGDFRIFLESETFSSDTNNKERRQPDITERKGVMASMGLSGRSSVKYLEQDPFLAQSKEEIDILEGQLKGLDKALGTVIGYRRSLAQTCKDFATSLDSLAQVELSSSLSSPLKHLELLQLRIEELYNRQAEQDDLTVGIVINEYIRMIGSIKSVYAQRQKAYSSWHTARNELGKKQVTQEKLLRTSRNQTSLIEQTKNDVDHAERRVNQARLLFEEIGRLMVSELGRFKKEKVEDFKSGVETYLESAVETQKQLIELWEMFRLQLDADEQGVTLAQVIPAGVIAAEDPGSKSAVTQSEGPTDESILSEDHQDHIEPLMSPTAESMAWGSAEPETENGFAT